MMSNFWRINTLNLTLLVSTRSISRIAYQIRISFSAFQISIWRSVWIAFARMTKIRSLWYVVHLHSWASFAWTWMTEVLSLRLYNFTFRRVTSLISWKKIFQIIFQIPNFKMCYRRHKSGLNDFYRMRHVFTNDIASRGLEYEWKRAPKWRKYEIENQTLSRTHRKLYVYSLTLINSVMDNGTCVTESREKLGGVEWLCAPKYSHGLLSRPFQTEAMWFAMGIMKNGN